MRASPLLVAAALFVPGPANADEGPLSEAEIVAALSGRTAISSDAASPNRQYFDPNGETTYVPEGGAADVGRWRVGNGRYCSHWGGRGWDCYLMTGVGDAVTWIWPESGQTYPARMVDGNALK